MADQIKNNNTISENEKTSTAEILSSVDNLILYDSLKEDPLISELRLYSERFKLKESGNKSKNKSSAKKRRNLNKVISELVKFSENKGLSGDLWHNYIKGLLLSDLNTFSLNAEKEKLNPESSLYKLAADDLIIIADLLKITFADLLNLFDFKQYNYLYPYQPQTENDNEISKFNSLFKSILKKKKHEKNTLKDQNNDIAENKDNEINKNDELIDCNDNQYTYDLNENINKDNLISNLAEFYFKNGASVLNKSSAFYWKDSSLKIINNPDNITFSKIIGYQKQKDKLIANTESFLDNKKAHNVLLYGDSGTGKSSSVKALLNKYQAKGLRLIEINDEQIRELPNILDYLNQRGLYFIIFMDDLSFEEFETEYKYLKAVMEGGIELKPDNVLFYATSNRRHIVREKWQDREAEVHKNDILNEKLSLSERFGLTLMYNTPAQEVYLNIVRELAVQENIKIKKEELEEQALQWSQWNNGRSGRSARQFINEILKNN